MNFLCTLVVMGGWVVVVCKPILVFSFGPNQALGLRFDWDEAKQKLKNYYETWIAFPRVAICWVYK